MMGPVTATKNALRKPLDFRGRASRAEYWWFLPVGLLLPLLVGIAVKTLTRETAIWPVVLVVVISALPLVAVTTRRLRDTGEHHEGVAIPTIQLVGLTATIWLWSRFHGWAMHGFQNADGPGGFGLSIIFLIGTALFFLATARFFILGVITGFALFSQMAAPTREPKYNVTSNPNEVPS